jgi:hypothetical protein
MLRLCCAPNAPELGHGALVNEHNQTAWGRRRLQLLVRPPLDDAVSVHECLHRGAPFAARSVARCLERSLRMTLSRGNEVVSLQS